MSAVLDCSQTKPGDRTVEIAIIGSGYAGATAAWELARAGHEVLVLEEGGDFTGPKLTQRDGAMYDQLYMDRGGRTTSDRSISVLQGRVLGGGGVINASDVVPMHDEVLRHWQRKYGLTGFSPEALAPFRDRALEDLHANEPREDQLNANNRLLRAGTERLGWRGEVMRHNRVDCAGVGTCLIGCPLDRKRNARFVAIPAALEAGATFFTRARVTRLEDAARELKTLRVKRLDAKGYHELDEFTVRAKTVILAANAIGSTALLLRSGVGNARVGRHVSLQPQLPLTARFDEEVRFARGIPQSYAVTQFEQFDHPDHGLWGFRIEAIAGTPGIVGSILPELGRPGLEAMKQFQHMTASLLLLPDSSPGAVRVASNGRLSIDFPFDEALKARLREAIKAAARVYFAAGAREVQVPLVPALRLTSEAELALVDQVPFLPATAPFLSAHQQGGVRMAPSERDGAANPEGLVYGTQRVFVFDSAGFPSSASSHIMAPIIMISRWLCRGLL
ncbi:MAG: FAD-dependent oxidoreductase [Myxococcota bacterium]